MKTLKFTLRPRSAFATPLAGDTLFGQLCWTAREQRGEARLRELLDGYVDGHPFLVVSDGFPGGLLPRPTAPDFALGAQIDPARRKEARTHRWLPAVGADQPVRCWINDVTPSESIRSLVLTQNTINRYTGTTGEGPFAPRQVERRFFTRDSRIDVYAAIDERLSADTLHELLADVGSHGYGRDATTGLGKFAVEGETAEPSWMQGDQMSDHWLTLAPCQPNPKELVADGCYYTPLTRFGRHGNIAAIMAQPFKRPLMMIATGALLQSREPARWAVHGRGLGGRADPISSAIPETVHQGYAPVLPLRLEPVQ